jgi:hypothetical protein
MQAETNKRYGLLFLSRNISKYQKKPIEIDLTAGDCQEARLLSISRFVSRQTFSDFASKKHELEYNHMYVRAGAAGFKTRVAAKD